MAKIFLHGFSGLNRSSATLLYLFILLVITSCKFSFPDYGNNEKVGNYYNIRGIKLYCEVYGSGKPLLMIHGNGGSIGTFKDNIPYFSERYKVIVADSRSAGKSIDERDSLSFEMMADDYAALLDSLHVNSASVFGWSDGGIAGLLLAIRHPEKVNSLAVSGANIWPGYSAIQQDEWNNEKREQFMLGKIAHKTEEERFKYKQVNLDIKQPNIFVWQLNKITCPTFVICGDNDIIRRKHTELIFESIPKANLWIVSHSGHYTLNRINNRVDEFFSHPFRDSNGK